MNYQISFTLSVLIFSAITSAVYAGMSAGITIILLAYTILRFFASSHRQPTWQNSSLLLVGTIYIAFFVVREMFVPNGDASYIIESNIAFVILGVICILAPSQQRSTLNISLIIAIGLCIVFFVYYAMKISCDISLMDPSIKTELFHGNCSRVRFLSKNALMVGGVVSTLVSMIYVTIDWSKKTQFFVASLAISTGLFLIIFGMQSRGATLAVGVGIPFGLYWIAKNYFPRMSITQFATSSFLFIVISILPYLNDQVAPAFKRIEIASNMMTSETDIQDGSVSTRLDMYKSGLRAFKDQPILGHGYSNRFDAAIPYMERSGRHHHLHNAIINHLVAGGVIGLFAYLALFTVGIHKVRPKGLYSFFETPQKFLLTQIYANFFIVGLTTATMGHFVNTTFFATAIAIALLYQSERQL